MSDAPKLLTEAEARELLRGFSDPDKRLAELRERGLIAPERDPLDVEAERIIEATYASVGAGSFDLALAALKRGMELAQPPLTREMVRGAVIGAKPNLLQSGDFTRECHMAEAEAFIDRLHAALTERQP